MTVDPSRTPNPCWKCAGLKPVIALPLVDELWATFQNMLPTPTPDSFQCDWPQKKKERIGLFTKFGVSCLTFCVERSSILNLLIQENWGFILQPNLFFLFTNLANFQILSNHVKCVTALRWSGEGLIYSASQDRTIKVWRAKDVSRFGYILFDFFLFFRKFRRK